ncbi:hypothetical protein JS541_09760 [Bifidobacterium sp. SO1]|nr:hypothetical protein [Bifidobacterium sp. SO1]
MWDYSHDPDRTTFVEQTERTFGITRLVCDWDCPDYKLPDDRDTASWIRGNRLEHGRFIIEGNRVGLAGPDGTLLKEAE